MGFQALSRYRVLSRSRRKLFSEAIDDHVECQVQITITYFSLVVIG